MTIFLKTQLTKLGTRRDTLNSATSNIEIKATDESVQTFTKTSGLNASGCEIYQILVEIVTILQKLFQIL
jgi:hypothetical protein